MPIIAVFFGIFVRVFHADHDPPHIHVQYGEFSAIVSIKNGVMLKGKLPRQAERLVREWLKRRRREILKAWGDARAHKTPRRVKPIG